MKPARKFIIPPRSAQAFEVQQGKILRLVDVADDLIEMEAEMDCLVAIATCAAPVFGKANAPYRVEIYDKKSTMIS